MVTSASHGLDANDSVRLAEASITMDAGKDGIHAENTDDGLDSNGTLCEMGIWKTFCKGHCCQKLAGNYLRWLMRKRAEMFLVKMKNKIIFLYLSI